MSFITNKNTTKCSSQSTNYKIKNPKHRLQINQHPTLIKKQNNPHSYSYKGSPLILVGLRCVGFSLLLPCALVFWFALALCLFLPLFFVGFGIGWLFAVCFPFLVAVVFGWLGCLYCFAILWAYFVSYCVFCFGGFWFVLLRFVFNGGGIIGG